MLKIGLDARCTFVYTNDNFAKKFGGIFLRKNTVKRMLKKHLDARCTFVYTNDNFARFSRNEKLQKKRKEKAICGNENIKWIIGKDLQNIWL